MHKQTIFPYSSPMNRLVRAISVESGCGLLVSSETVYPAQSSYLTTMSVVVTRCANQLQSAWTTVHSVCRLYYGKIECVWKYENELVDH